MRVDVDSLWPFETRVVEEGQSVVTITPPEYNCRVFCFESGSSVTALNLGDGPKEFCFGKLEEVQNSLLETPHRLWVFLPGLPEIRSSGLSRYSDLLRFKADTREYIRSLKVKPPLFHLFRGIRSSSYSGIASVRISVNQNKPSYDKIG